MFEIESYSIELERYRSRQSKKTNYTLFLSSFPVKQKYRTNYKINQSIDSSDSSMIFSSSLISFDFSNFHLFQKLLLLLNHSLRTILEFRKERIIGGRKLERQCILKLMIFPTLKCQRKNPIVELPPSSVANEQVEDHISGAMASPVRSTQSANSTVTISDPIIVKLVHEPPYTLRLIFPFFFSSPSQRI